MSLQTEAFQYCVLFFFLVVELRIKPEPWTRWAGPLQGGATLAPPSLDTLLDYARPTKVIQRN